MPTTTAQSPRRANFVRAIAVSLRSSYGSAKESLGLCASDLRTNQDTANRMRHVLLLLGPDFEGAADHRGYSVAADQCVEFGFFAAFGYGGSFQRRFGEDQFQEEAVEDFAFDFVFGQEAVGAGEDAFFSGDFEGRG